MSLSSLPLQKLHSYNCMVMCYCDHSSGLLSLGAGTPLWSGFEYLWSTATGPAD